MASIINIYYSADKRLFTQFLVSLISLTETNKDNILNVYNLDVEIKEYNASGKKLSSEQIALCEKLLKNANPKNTFTEIDVSDLTRKNLMIGKNWNKNPWYKFPAYLSIRWLIHLCKEVKVDKILWLDCDTIIRKNLSDLWEININKYEIAGHVDTKKLRFNLFFQGELTRKYIQTGVMLINLKLMKENKTIDKILNYIQNKKIYQMIDMTSMNKVVKKKKLFSKYFNNYYYDKNNYIHHICSTWDKPPYEKPKRNTKVVKSDNIDLMPIIYPQYKPIYIKLKNMIKANKKLF